MILASRTSRPATVLVLQADTLRLPLADESADLILVSPPYYNVRDYGCPGQLGLEPTPAAYLEVLWAATREWVRVLKPTGSLWVNLGDKYSGHSGEKWGNGRSLDGHGRASLRGMPTGPRRAPEVWGIPSKSLIGLPWLYALGCTGALAMVGGADPGLGLRLRREVIWHKQSPLPESVKDRPPTAHEYLFCFSKQRYYFAGADEIRLPHTMRPQRRPNGHKARQQLGALPPQTYSTSQHDEPDIDGHPLGKIPGSVWPIAGEPFRPPDYLVEDDRGWRFLDAREAWRYAELRRQEPEFAGPILAHHVEHHAAMPTELARRVILGWSPSGICLACGEGRWPVNDEHLADDRPGRRQHRDGDALERAHGADGRTGDRHASRAAIIGYACPCTPSTWHPGSGRPSPTAGPDGRQGERPADIAARHRRVGAWREYHFDHWTPPPTRPAVVVDPCCGSGTVPAVARVLGRDGIGVDLSWDYTRLTTWRAAQPTVAAKVLARTNQEAQQTLAV